MRIPVVFDVFARAGRAKGSLRLAVSLACFAIIASSASQLRANDLIGPGAPEGLQEKLSPATTWCIAHGMTIRVAPYRHVTMPRKYRDATEKYATQVRLSHDDALENYVAGLPFPIVDTNDPRAAAKIVWNHLLSWGTTDDSDLRGIRAETGSLTPDGKLRTEATYRVQDLREMGFLGRIFGDSGPAVMGPPGVARAMLLGPFDAPGQWRGMSFLLHRFADPSRRESAWMYMPDMRKVREVPAFDPSSAQLGQDIDFHSMWGYSGRLGDMKWKYLGERTVFASVHGANLPSRRATAGSFAFEDVWEPRTVYVIEGSSSDPVYSYGKRILYVDKETFVIPHSEIYSPDGQLWKMQINFLSFRPRTAPPGGTAETDEFPHYAGILMVDAQTSHATTVELASADAAANSGWYYNWGESSGIRADIFAPSRLDQMNSFR